MRLEITANSPKEGDVDYMEACIDDVLQLLSNLGFRVQSCATSAGNVYTRTTTNPIDEMVIDVEYENIKEEDINNESIK